MTTREHPLGWPRALPPSLSPCRIDPTKGAGQHRCSATHADRIESYRLWRDHLNAEAEEWALGYATETETYWREVRPGQRPNLPRFLTMMIEHRHDELEDEPELPAAWDDEDEVA